MQVSKLVHTGRANDGTEDHLSRGSISKTRSKENFLQLNVSNHLRYCKGKRNGKYRGVGWLVRSDCEGKSLSYINVRRNKFDSN